MLRWGSHNWLASVREINMHILLIIQNSWMILGYLFSWWSFTINVEKLQIEREREHEFLVNKMLLLFVRLSKSNVICCPDDWFFFYKSASKCDEVALTVNIQPGSAGHNPCFVLGWHSVPPGVFLCSSLNKQADVAVVILVHAGEKDKVIRALNF